MRVLGFSALLGLLAAQPAASQVHHPVWDPATAQWAPAGAGLEMAPILGDSDKPGSFAIAFRLKAGSWIPPHTHPRPKQVTVLSGALKMGFGSVLDSTTVTEVAAGKVVVVPPTTAHYEGSTIETVVIFSGEGPLTTNWIRPPAKPRP